MAKAYFRWKEEMVYEHAGRALLFEAPMGVTPHAVYVPTADVWPSKVPAWAVDERDQVLRTIRAVAGVAAIIEVHDARVVERS